MKAASSQPVRAARRWGIAFGAAMAVAVSLFLLGKVRSPKASPGTEARFVSLSPAVTATLLTLGARPQLVGVSDYCHFAADVGDIRRVGSGYTPRYEAIVSLMPTAVFVEAVNASNLGQLSPALRIEPLPWLTLDEVVASTRKIGQITGKTAAAERLAASYVSRLQSRVGPESPRILLVMAHVPGAFKEVVFIRKNSIHGRVLEAAGARNAVDEEVPNAPRLSLEQVLARDPDGIVILQPAVRADPRLIEDWKQLAVLRAVKTNHIATIAANDVAIPGPQLLRLVERLALLVGPWKKSA